MHEAFAPSAAEIEKAAKIVAAFDEAQQRGVGVVSLGSKMIDLPVVERAQKLMERAKKDRESLAFSVEFLFYQIPRGRGQRRIPHPAFGRYYSIADR